MYGTTTRTDDGHIAIVFERHLGHPPDRVWHAITAAEPLAAWFPAAVDFELKAGATLRFGPTLEQHRRYGLTDDDATFGMVKRVAPGRLLEFTWDRDLLRWALEPDEVNGTHLTFTHVIDDVTSAPPLAAGWHAGLEVLEAQLDGEPISWSPWTRAEELEDEYLVRLG